MVLELGPMMYLFLFAVAVVIVLGVVAYFVVSGMGSQIASQATTISELKRTLEQRDAKLLAEAGRIDRRDRAISASKCKAQIEDWIRHPEKVPDPFDPFTKNSGG